MSSDPAPLDIATAVGNTNMLVIAPPGCGKTELLARRAEALIPHLLPNQRILALTFSNKAKANLNNRLLSVLGAERKRRYVTVHNFHGHAAEVLVSHGRSLGVDPGFAMPDKKSQSGAIAPNLSGLSIANAAELSRLIEDTLREAKQRPVSDKQVLDRLALSPVFEAHQIERDRQSANTMFYDDLLRHAQRLLRVREVAHLYQAHYGAVLVDEFQDLSLQQLDIAMRTCRASRTFVGDPLQGIYSWTGAEPVRVEALLRRLCGEPFSLGHSFRSSPRVLDLVNLVSQGLGGGPIESQYPDAWFEDGIAAAAVLPTAEDEAIFIEDICGRILEVQPEATIGVICRSGWRRLPIDRHMAASRLPITRWDLPIDDPLIVDLIGNASARLGPGADLADVQRLILSELPSSDVDTAAEVVDALIQMDTLVSQSGSVGAALAQMRAIDDPEESIQPGVHLLNAHTGKGQQFDWVFVPGFEDGHVPSFLAKGTAGVEEEHRVLLVMLSRARHGLILTRAGQLTSKAGNPYTPKPSRWTGEAKRAGLASAEQLKEHISRYPAKR